MAFKNGDIDWCDVSADMLTQYSNDPDVKDCITLYNTLGVHFVNLNLQSDNLKDVKVREALSMAIDRQALIDNTLSGAGEPAGCWLAPATPGHDDSAKLDYDPEKAKQLLAEAGVSNLTLDAKIRKGQYEKYMTVIQSYWAEIGVTLNLTVEDTGVWQSDWADGNLEVTALGWFPLYADADNHMCHSAPQRERQEEVLLLQQPQGGRAPLLCPRLPGQGRARFPLQGGRPHHLPRGLCHHPAVLAQELLRGQELRQERQGRQPHLPHVRP